MVANFFWDEPNQIITAGIYPLTKLTGIQQRQLIQSCLQGNRHSQNELYGLFAPRMFTVCLRYGKDRHEAEEILQEGFIKVFSSLHQYRHEGSLEGWVRRIMVTTALQRLRGRTPIHALLSVDGTGHHEAPEEESSESKLSAKELLALVQSLPAVYRAVFNLYVFEGYRHKEISELLGISEGTSKSNLYDARQWLKEKIVADHKRLHPKKKCL
ncbi:MAG: RNA polymerase sigma factor [Flavisolibacter sp.]